MRLPVYTPISTEAERIAALLLKLEESPAPLLALFTLAVRTGARSEGKVVATLDDGGREVFTPAEARLFARCLRAEGAFIEASQYAEALFKAADEAEARASSGALAVASGDRRTHPLLTMFRR